MKDIREIMRYSGVNMVKLCISTGNIAEESEKVGATEFYEKICELFAKYVRERVYAAMCSEYEESTDTKKRFYFSPATAGLYIDTGRYRDILSVKVRAEYKRKGEETLCRTLCQNWGPSGRIVLFGEVFEKNKNISPREQNFFADSSVFQKFPQGVYKENERETVRLMPFEELRYRQVYKSV